MSTHGASSAGGLATLTKETCSLEDRSTLLDDTGWADNLSWEQIRTLVQYIDVYHIPETTPIFHEGAHEAYMGIIAAGSIEILKENANHEQKGLAVLDRGKTFGEMTLLDYGVRSASAVATQDVILLVLTEESMQRLVEEVPQLAVATVLKIAKLMSQRLRRTSGMLVDYLESGNKSG